MADLAGFYPVTTAPQNVEVRPITPTQTTQSFSGKTRRSGYGGQFYELKLSYGPMTNLQHRPIQGFLAQAYGPQLSFEVVLPQISYSASTNPPSTTPSVVGGLSKGAKTVGITNCGANKTVLVGGDFFRFNDHSKVYQATNTITSDGSGNATLFFAGSAVEDVAGGVQLTITAVPFTMILKNPSQSYNIGTGGIGSFNVEMREVW